jgi:hypothetical protein
MDVMLLVQGSLVAPPLDIKAQHHFHKENEASVSFPSFMC